MEFVATYPPLPLSERSTLPPEGYDKKEIREQIEGLQQSIVDLQRLLYADGKHSLLVILQGMDASGKDGSLNAILHGMTALGCSVTGFKKPSNREMNHDFLWRVHQVVPERGRVAIFNRSHYEDVLVQRVHKWVPEDRIRRRFEHINAFERLLLEENGTRILKFYLHVSKEEQLERLMERKSVRRKMWKHNPGDMAERERWDDYMKAYEDVFLHCGPDNPWHVVPADKNWYKEYYLLNVILRTLESLDMAYPHYSENA
jgi:PPK2 family polyphosphate:nucleotide phosphotransferase